MKIQLTPDAIELMLAASTYTDKRTTGAPVPILSHILVDLKSNGLLAVSAVCDGRFHSGVARVQGDFEPGLVAIKADKFSSLLKCLPEGGNATLTANDSSAQLTCGRSRYKLSTSEPSSFPRMPEMENMQAEIELSSVVLQQGLERVMKAMAVNDVRNYLEGVCLEIHPDKVVFVATDGHRLSYDTFAQSNPVSDITRVLLPRQRVLDLLAVMRKSDNGVRIRFNDKAARVYSTDLKWIFQFTLIETRFPDYRRAIPNASAMPKLQCKRLEFISALERISHVVSKTKNPACVIRATGNDILISAKAQGESDDSGEELVSNLCHSGDVTSSFNIHYLLDALKKLDDGVIDLHMENTKPCFMTGAEQQAAFHVVMPIRM